MLNAEQIRRIIRKSYRRTAELTALRRASLWRPAAPDEYQRDYNEWIEEMSYGGQTYDPNETERTAISVKR